jgi:ATP-binding protein involved in chromosome partitioning
MPSTSSFSDNDVRTALRLVQAPCMSIDVVAAGMIGDIRIEGADISLDVVHRVPSQFVADGFEDELRRALQRHLPNLASVELQFTTDIPASTAAEGRAVVPGVRNTIAVASGKGGVGKSTVAVNLAIALAKGGATVGLIDADIYGPSIPLMMNVHEQPRAYRDGDKTRLLPTERYGVQLMSIGFLVKAEDAVIWRGPMAGGALKQFLTDVEWGALDYLLFDLPPGTGDIQLTLSQTLPLTGAVIVTTPQDIALADARKGVRMFEKVSVPILGIVENMSYYLCSQCGHRDEIFNHGGGRFAASEMNIPFLGDIPLTTQVREAGDAGMPIVEASPDSSIAQSFREAAMQLAGSISQRNLTEPGSPVIDISL